MPVIRMDRSHRLIEVKLVGFYTPERAHQGALAVRAAITRLGGEPNSHLTLYNLDRLQVASPQAFAELHACFAVPELRKYWARRVAFYSSAALVRMQVARLKAERPDIGVFAQRDAAIDWLINPGHHPGLASVAAQVPSRIGQPEFR